MDRVPDSAVCNEAVKMAVKRHFSGLKGFVNGVLRTISREKENLTFDTPSCGTVFLSGCTPCGKRNLGKKRRRRLPPLFLKISYLGQVQPAPGRPGEHSGLP